MDLCNELRQPDAIVLSSSHQHRCIVGNHNGTTSDAFCEFL